MQLKESISENEYLASVVEQYYPNQKPSKKVWKLLESNRSFDQLIKEYRKSKKKSNKICILLKAVEKADSETKILKLSREVALNMQEAGTIINMIDTIYPNNQNARKVIEAIHNECYASIVSKTNELVEKAKELRDIIKSFNL